MVGVSAARVLTQPWCRGPMVCGKTGGGPARQRGMSAHHRLMHPICRPYGPPVDVVMWRRCRLLDAGFPEALAMQLANASIDLHALLQLVDRGCPPELAARILAPLDEPAHETGTPR